MDSTSMTSKYMSFSPALVNERNVALNNCPTKSGRCQIYKTYYLKMKDAYEKHEDEDDEDYEPSEEDEEEDDDEDYEEEEDEDYEEEEDEEDDEDYEEYDEDEDDEDYEPSEAEEEEDDEDYEEDEEEEDDEDYEDEEASEAEEPANTVIEPTQYCCCAVEANANEVEANESDENAFGCPGCNYEWRDGYKNGWKDAMKYIARKTYKEAPPTPACSYCDIVCKTRKCGGKCGGTVRYCSIDCQKQDWAYGHKAKCGK